MLLFAASCTKEGVFNPKEKIVKISEMEINSSTMSFDGTSTTTTDTTPKHVTQEWKWDGKLLTTITNYYLEHNQLTDTYTSVVSSVMTLTYDGKQLIKVADATGKDYTEYTYDGSKLVKMTSYEDGELFSTAEITHDGKKIATVVITFNGDYGKKASDVTRFAMSTIMPTKSVLDKVCAPKATKDGASTTQTLTFTYDGKNVTKIDVAYKYGEETDNITLEYTFDKNKNPFCGLFASIGEDGFSALNENNILTEKQTYTYVDDGRTQSEISTDTYEYEYDGKFPTSVTTTNIYGGSTYSQKTVHTTYYEYAE